MGFVSNLIHVSILFLKHVMRKKNIYIIHIGNAYVRTMSHTHTLPLRKNDDIDCGTHAANNGKEKRPTEPWNKTGSHLSDLSVCVPRVYVCD